MSRKRKTNTNDAASNYDIMKFCAFWGLAIAAVAALLSFLFKILGVCGIEISWSGRVVGICNTISQIALLVSVILGAYRYVRGRNAVYKAFFWVAVILVILGLVGLNLI